MFNKIVFNLLNSITSILNKRPLLNVTHSPNNGTLNFTGKRFLFMRATKKFLNLK